MTISPSARLLFAAGILSCALPLGMSAQAATITINGTAGSIPGGLGTGISNNNVENNLTNLGAGYGGFQGPANGSGWFFNGSVQSNLSSYQVIWYFLGSESGNTNTLASGLPNFTSTELNQNNNCSSCGSSAGFQSQNSIATTTSSSLLIPLTLSDNPTGLVASNGGANGNSIMYAYVTPTTINFKPGWAISDSPTDWFAFGWNDNGSTDADFDDFMGVAHVTAVPGPLAGAGLPGLIAACVGLVALARRRRNSAVSA